MEMTTVAGSIRESIWYAGKLCLFVQEYDDADEVQIIINHKQKWGMMACCLHENGKHQLYVSERN